MTLTFEKALARLGEISEEMEKPDLPLDSAVKLYAEASELAAFCKKNITEAKLSVEKINAEINNV